MNNIYGVFPFNGNAETIPPPLEFKLGFWGEPNVGQWNTFFESGFELPTIFSKPQPQHNDRNYYCLVLALGAPETGEIISSCRDLTSCTVLNSKPADLRSFQIKIKIININKNKNLDQFSHRSGWALHLLCDFNITIRVSKFNDLKPFQKSNGIPIDLVNFLIKTIFFQKRLLQYIL